MTNFGIRIFDGCRLGIRPGFQNPTDPGQIGTTPIVLVPADVSSTDPFKLPIDPPVGGGGGGGRPPGGGSGGGRIPPAGPSPPGTGGGGGGPSTGGPTRPADTRGPRRPGPTTGGGVGGPTAGGPSAGTPHRCQELRYVCPDDLGLPLSQQRVRSIYKSCVPEDPLIPPGVVASGTQPNSTGFNEGYLVVIGNTVFSSKQKCEQNCVPTQQVFSQSCVTQTGGLVGEIQPTVGEPTTGLGQTTNEPLFPDPPQSQAYVKQIVSEVTVTQQNQNASNGDEVSVDETLAPTFQSNLRNNQYEPLIYDLQKNFFKVPQTTEIISTTQNGNYPKVFRRSVAQEVGILLYYQNEKTSSWSETAIQNITDDKLIFSLKKNLVEAFNNLRDLTGNPIGMSTFLEVVRKHLVTGTMDEFNPNYYLDIYNRQKSNSFTTIAKSESESSNQVFSLLYLKDGEYGLETSKPEWQNRLQMGRFRFLNEDVGVTVRVEQLGGVENNLEMPNEGIPITFITPKDASTPISVGSPDLLNIGDGGGYYVDSTLLDSSNTPVYTENLASGTFYAPPYVRSSLLNLLDEGFDFKIVAESLADQHEFVSGDAGVSELSPLYFGINLSTVSSFDYGEGTVESYSASYSRITDAYSIQQHINNNALSIPELYVDYRDPLYRYILDTSGFSVKSSDISSRGFVSNPQIFQQDNFVKNVPFGFVIIPSRGSNFNPFNGRSVVKSYGDKVTRELTVRPSLTVNSEEQKTNFEFYNLFLEDGSKRVGSYEEETIHNFGYRYQPSAYYNSFYSDGSITTSSNTVSSYGASYLLKDVMDFIKDEYDPNSVVWFDIFSRMPLSRIGELFYDLPEGFLEDLENGYRHGITIKNAQKNPNNPVSLLQEDSKTIVKTTDRPTILRV